MKGDSKMERVQTDIHYYIDLVSRRRWLIGVPTVVLTALGLALAVSLPSYYRSTTVIMVEKQQVPEAYVTPTDKTPFNQRLNTLRQQIMSRPKLEKIINDYHLYQDGLSGSPVTAALKRLGLNVKTGPGSKEGVLDRMSDDIDAKVIGGSAGDAFSISYSSTDPNVAMQVTNTLASLFIEENLKAREEYAEGTSDFLADELANAKKTLEIQERAVRAYKEKYMGALPQELDSNLRTLDRLQAELQTVVNEEKGDEDRRIILDRELGHSASGARVQNPLAGELAKLQENLASLLSMYKEDYPDVVMTRKRIKEIKALLAKNESESNQGELEEVRPEVRNPEVYNNLMSVKSRISALKLRESEIRKQLKSLEGRVEQTPANEQRFADLRRDYDISLKNYQTLLEKKLNAKLSENLEKRQKGERFSVIDPANLPEKPFKPRRTFIAIFGLAAGLGTGLGLAMLLDFMNPAFRRPEDFEGVLNLPVLAAIPEFSTARGASNGLKMVKGGKAGL